MLKIAWSPIYCHPVPENHRFPMEKYNLVTEQLKYEGVISDENLFSPIPASDVDIAAVHSAAYVSKLKLGQLSRSEERATGFKWSEQLIAREIAIMGGTIGATENAIKYGIGANIAGGTHHAFSNKGEGFCLLNDLAIAAKWAQKKYGIDHVLILDLDVHQGNGTAQIFRNDDSVFTFSMHGAKNYPMHKPESDLDIHLEDGIADDAYLQILERNLNNVLHKFKPELVLYQCGVDILAEDKLGRLNLTLSGCKNRDLFVLQTLHALNIPVAFALGGGYAPKISTIVQAHANTFKIAADLVH